VGDVVYMNCGDWIENCTALVEDFTGKISLINFHERKRPESEEGNAVHATNEVPVRWPLEATEAADGD
jgi:hypothetical protein